IQCYSYLQPLENGSFHCQTSIDKIVYNHCASSTRITSTRRLLAIQQPTNMKLLSIFFVFAGILLMLGVADAARGNNGNNGNRENNGNPTPPGLSGSPRPSRSPKSTEAPKVTTTAAPAVRAARPVVA
uniref:Uncharacterized protein n=2 Tax=gambiae species complex TaxID=44542 RepID=A0A182HHB0_ANOAR